MSCPTCDHTIESIGHNWFHCPRCGTVVLKIPSRPDSVYVPKLVERCRQFEPALDTEEVSNRVARLWHTFGISESINLPEDRP
jgi:hypothetical protein